ncbi:maleylpyruvate isomerase family mycothiol-dependent enzyme [Gordonia sp. NPDC003424]
MDRSAVIAAEAQRFADVLATTDPQRRCPTCPDWTAADLLWHLTSVHFFWAEILGRHLLGADGLPAVEAAKPERPREIADMLDLRARATDALLEQLARRGDDEPCWSWWPADQTVGFTRRMQTYEATMHRIDAELTAEVPPSPIPGDVAAGAVDHAVDIMWGWLPDGTEYRAAGVVEFRADDIGQSWLVEVGGCTGQARQDDSLISYPRATRSVGGVAAASVAAPVTDLALWAWTRGGSVEMTGDPVVLAALDAVVSKGMV